MFPLWAWIFFGGLVLGLLALDLLVFHRKAHKVGVREATWTTAFWVSVALAFGGFVWALAGTGVAGEYLTGYLVEWSLSVDNVFVFSLIFTSFAVPEEYRYRVLFWGVIGALVARAVFVGAGASLLSAFGWLVFVFGIFLVFTGLRMLRRGSGGEKDPQNNRALRLLRRFLPVTKDYHGGSFLTRHGNKLYATPLLAVLVVVESSDIVFAVDSVPAVLSITKEPFVVYSSNVFAILGLRHLYFLLEGAVDRFTYLHYGLAAVLIFVGAKFLLEGFGLHIPIAASLPFIALAVGASIAVSLIATRRRGGAG
ncbi:TerC family protein [Rubrobacter aplysinae]|uniref:TerC family protein n=1 Tax=Rubrobacter aplysinae TaxID=909625 RepID=UPI000AC61714|nr:TerC family protein [Rubrobacter aplysinae]